MFLEESYQKEVNARIKIIAELLKGKPKFINVFCHCPECNSGIDFREEPYKTMLEEELKNG